MWTAKEQQTWANHRVRICRRHEATKAIKRSTVWCNPMAPWFWTFEDSELHQGQWEDTLRRKTLWQEFDKPIFAHKHRRTWAVSESRGPKSARFVWILWIILKWRTRTQILEKGGFTSLVLFLRSFGLRPYWLCQAGRCRGAQLLHFAQSWWVYVGCAQSRSPTGIQSPSFCSCWGPDWIWRYPKYILAKAFNDVKCYEVTETPELPAWRWSIRETIPQPVPTLQTPKPVEKTVTARKRSYKCLKSEGQAVKFTTEVVEIDEELQCQKPSVETVKQKRSLHEFSRLMCFQRKAAAKSKKQVFPCHSIPKNIQITSLRFGSFRYYF